VAAVGDSTNFLYPFLEAPSVSTAEDATPLLTDLAASARAKAEESAALQMASLLKMSDQIDAAGAQMAERFVSGGRMYTFGNGGSSTDASTLATLFARPAHGRPLPGWCLAGDQAVVTALGNDVGFELVFSRQIIAHSRSNDIAVALSTSGNSDDLMRGLAEAKKRGLMTLGFAGYDGGQMATSKDVDFCFVVDSQSIHRIQESQALIGYRLWSVTQEATARLREQNRSARAETQQ
jgi:D-sedoheptulose 7-phosphate isomerase